MSTRDLSRRTVLAGACGSCTAVLAGCATHVTGRAAPTELPAVPPAAATPAPDASDDPDEEGTGVLAAASDIPVGSGKIFADAGIVVTQPTAGKFVAFAATCTHQGCTVSTISGNTVNCPCHGSKFALADGAVVNGPASTGLPAKRIKVARGEIRLV